MDVAASVVSILVGGGLLAFIQFPIGRHDAKHDKFKEVFEAIEKLTSKSLVVVCDHHSMDQTSSAKLVESAGRIAIIDHHRRKTEANILAMMIYNELTWAAEHVVGVAADVPEEHLKCVPI